MGDNISCLSHLGNKYTYDKISNEILAKESYDIDLIIGERRYLFLDASRRYTNKKSGDVLVDHVGWEGMQLGRLGYQFLARKNKNFPEVKTVIIGKKSRD